MDELEKDNAAIKSELDEYRATVLRQQNRIFKLEEKLESAERTDPM